MLTCSPFLLVSFARDISPTRCHSLALSGTAVTLQFTSSAHRLGARAFPIRDLPRLQRTVSLLCGLSSLSALVLHPPHGSSCRQVHDLLDASVHGILPQRLLLPSSCACECLARSVHSCGDRSPFCTQDLVPILSDPLVAASTFPSTSTRPLRTQRSILSVFLTTCHFRLPFFLFVVTTLVVLLTSNHWTTVGWNGPEFTRLPKVPPLLGSVNGFVVPVVRPRPFRTFLPCPQSRVLSVPPGIFSYTPEPHIAFCPTHFFPCLNTLFKNGSFLSVVALGPSKMSVSFQEEW